MNAIDQLDFDGFVCLKYSNRCFKESYFYCVIFFYSFKFKVTLFEQYVDELKAFVAAGETENTLVVVFMAKIKIWQGRLVYAFILNITCSI